MRDQAQHMHMRRMQKHRVASRAPGTTAADVMSAMMADGVRVVHQGPYRETGVSPRGTKDGGCRGGFGPAARWFGEVRGDLSVDRYAGLMTRPIHFVLDDGPSYQAVQSQLLDLIESHLPDPKPDRGSYRQGALNFTLFILQRADVVMSHGAADKNYLWTQDSRGRRVANRFSDLLVPGDFLRRRLVDSPTVEHGQDRVHTVGWPRLDVLLADLPERARSSGRATRPRVLWAPTHNKRKRGATSRSTSSFPAFGDYLEVLSRFATVDVSVHPRNRDDRTPTGASLPAADVVVADFGTTVYEAWALGKPVIFPRWLLADRITRFMPEAAESWIFVHRIGYHPESFDEMVDIIRSGPVITPDVSAFLDDYLAREYLGCSSRRVAEVLTEIAVRDDG